MSNQDINELPQIKVNVPSFLLKTYEILENPTLSHIITWNQEGNAFIVLNSQELASKVLANYFKHKNYPSFLRQLNMYSFKKTKNHYGQSKFKHKWFRKGLKSMLQYVRRRNSEDSENKIEIKNTNNQEIDNYQQQHDEMKKVVRDIQTTQLQMQVDFSASMEQNASSNRSCHTIIQSLNQMQQQFNKKFDNLYLLLIKIGSYIPNFTHSIGDISKYSYEEPSPSRLLEQNYLIPFNENNNQYSNLGSPYHQYSSNSPIHFLLSRQNQQFQDYCFQFDPNIFSFNKSNQQQQLALPAPVTNSYLPSNNYSLQSSSQNSPYRISSPIHTSSNDSKIPEKFNFFQQA
ncbi:unnamed protein product [Paramecium sonneborni]|uniref:HSF-type DNA-binding domain-containing protein n=1 Tax=Paramecium sonneborni TaxID=65129 RepID=A0A8S1MD64_9CILI|nr:unnamed protein product [Paramecium sonneborni]